MQLTTLLTSFILIACTLNNWASATPIGGGREIANRPYVSPRELERGSYDVVRRESPGDTERGRGGPRPRPPAPRPRPPPPKPPAPKPRPKPKPTKAPAPKPKPTKAPAPKPTRAPKPPKPDDGPGPDFSEFPEIPPPDDEPEEGDDA